MQVADLMSKDLVHFDVSSNLIDLSDCIEERSFRCVPITDEGQLVGIVRRSDVLKAIVSLKRQGVPATPA